MLPYALTILILAGGMVRSRPPAALGNSYRSGAASG
jgi:simple sugar transport system permease protein